MFGIGSLFKFIGKYFLLGQIYNWELPLTQSFVFVGGGLLALIYWARRKEKAHSHGELIGGMAVGLFVTAVGSLF